MRFITKKHLSRRSVLRGMGVTLGLPFLEAMVPAQTPLRKTAAAQPTRLACIEMVHGAAGSTMDGSDKHYWSPEKEGSDFEITPTLKSLEPFRDYLTIVSNTDSRNGEALEEREQGADHFRSATVFLTQAHPKMTEGSDIYAGPSMDQIYVQRFGQDTPLPSIQLSIENVIGTGACGYGYACIYADTISWSSPTTPLPMERDPRVAFERLFGDGGAPQIRSARRQVDGSILDWIMQDVPRLQKGLTSEDRNRLNSYLDDVREIERRIQRVEKFNSSGEARALPAAPIGVPDSFEEHVRLMFDLQALAFTTGVTRISAFKMSRDVCQRVYAESGVKTPFHSCSHHGENPARIAEYAKLNQYHVSQVPYFLNKLKNTPDGDGNLLDHSMILYGSSMGDSNAHNHKRVPIFLVGHANGRLKGNLHLKTPDGTPTANVLLTMLHRLGVEIDHIGDSTGELAI